MIGDQYARLKRQVLALLPEGRHQPTDDERADWACGNARLSNPDVRMSDARRAVRMLREISTDQPFDVSEIT